METEIRPWLKSFTPAEQAELSRLLMEPYRIKRLTFSAGVASDFSGAVDRSTHQLTAVIIAANLLSEVPINGEIDKGAMQLVAALSNRKFTPEQMTQLKATLRS